MPSEAELRATDDIVPWVGQSTPISRWIIDHRDNRRLARISEEGKKYIQWRRINNLPIFRGQQQYLTTQKPRSSYGVFFRIIYN